MSLMAFRNIKVVGAASSRNMAILFCLAAGSRSHYPIFETKTIKQPPLFFGVFKLE
jgi:hypothetical protein